jgi:MFS family permease
VRHPAAGVLAADPPGSGRQLAILAACVLLAFAPWFSASAVGPLLAAEWHTTSLDLPILTVAVQLGFAAAALILALTGTADVIPGPRLLGIGAVVTALANVGFAALANDVATAIPWRVLTGAGLAAVYPVALKMLAGWFVRRRGLAIGVVIGALTIGSALPHLFRAVGATSGLSWRPTVLLASVAAILAAGVLAAATRPGPFEVPASRFSPTAAIRALRQPSVRLATAGYLGHMWELYAMWTWAPAFIAASFAAAGTTDPGAAGLAAFVVVASGGIGCVVAGELADRLGRTLLTTAAMAISGGTAALIGLLFGAPPLLVAAVGVIWGISVVADSAQFSAAVSELAPAGTAGSALSLQLAAGFILTGVTILGVGVLAPRADSWRIAFWVLALGPVAGMGAMWRLRSRPDAYRMANGRR